MDYYNKLEELGFDKLLNLDIYIPTKEDLWISLGYDKSFNTPEEFFLYAIKGMKKVEKQKSPNIVLWEKNGEILFEQDFKNSELFVDYNKIWKVFETVFGLKYREVSDLIKELVEKHLNWTGLMPL